MPSIEIVCLGQLAPSDFSHLPFAVKSSAKLKSDRSPTPLFQPDFESMPQA